jgi:hypothetical protein
MLALADRPMQNEATFSQANTTARTPSRCSTEIGHDGIGNKGYRNQDYRAWSVIATHMTTEETKGVQRDDHRQNGRRHAFRSAPRHAASVYPAVTLAHATPAEHLVSRKAEIYGAV